MNFLEMRYKINTQFEFYNVLTRNTTKIDD